MRVVGKEGWFEEGEGEGNGGGVPLSRLGVILAARNVFALSGRASLITTVGRSARDSQRGSFMILPICSPTLSAEALVTLPNTCKPSGFPTTAKTIVAHCGWCYKERRKTLLGGGRPNVSMRLMWLHPQGLEFQFDLER